jgi:glutathione peroxidase
MSIYDLTVTNVDGEPFALSQLKGKVTLVVNVASQCGFTPQYTGLRELQAKYADRGFTVLAFPCNQFGAQEPEACPRIKAFAQDKYQAQFPIMDKIDVNGETQSPVYAAIQSAIPGKVKWNFEKVLIDKEGQAVQKFNSLVEPSAIAEDIERLLDASTPTTAASASSSSPAAL